MGFGGITALGCTVGQGMAGLSTLAIGSFIAVAGIVTGCVATLRHAVARGARGLEPRHRPARRSRRRATPARGPGRASAAAHPWLLPDPAPTRTATAGARIVDDELDVCSKLVPMAREEIVELGCGAAHLARSLLERCPRCRVTGLPKSTSASTPKNLAAPRPTCALSPWGRGHPVCRHELRRGADAQSRCTVPLPLFALALARSRVLRPRGVLYVRPSRCTVGP